MAPTNKKTQGRQTNNSLSSMTEHIVISPPTATSETSRKKKTVTNNKSATEIFTETEEVLQIGMHKVLEHVKNHDDAWPFMDPVEEDIAPRYYSIIRRPMDLQKMEEKLDNAEYNTFSEFKNDFKLIVNNCRLYNGQNNEYTEMVNNLQIAFEKATKKYFDQNSSDEETFFDFLDVKHDAFHEKVLSEKIKNKKLLQLDIDNDDHHISKKRKNGEGKHEKDDEIFHSSSSKNSKKDEKKSSEHSDPKKDGIKKSSSKQYESPKVEKNKIDYDNIESTLKKKDKKKIIKEIKKKHKEKGKIKGKIKKERGRPKGSHKHRDKLPDSKMSDISDDDRSEDNFTQEAPVKKEKSDKKHKKEAYKLLKKEKEKKSKHKSSSKKSKRHSIDHESSINDYLSDVSSSEFDDEENVISEKKSSSSSYKKSDKRFDDLKNDEKLSHEQKLKKKKKKLKKISEEIHDEVVEKRKPGRPKTKHLESNSSRDHEHKKEKKKKQKSHDKKKNKESVMQDAYFSGSEVSNHSLNNNFNFDDNSMDRPLTPDIVDKYDLIKQRRRQKQSEDSRGKQSTNERASATDKSAINKKQSKANDVSLSKSSAKYESNNKKSNSSVEDKLHSPSSSKEPKNHRLQETIEKLKKKSKKSKKENALLDEIFGVKPTKQLNDEKSVYKKIRETYGGEKESSGSHKKITDVAAKQPKNICEYDFIDDMVASKTGFEEKSSSNRKSTPIDHTFVTPSKKKEQAPSSKHTHKSSSKNDKHHQKSAKKQEKANMEALELETEQTLKDINKWLELTPHMSEFGSASSSPSRYIIDEFDAVPTRTDDFIRTVPIMQENQENHQNLNSQFDALKNDGKVGLHDHNVSNKQSKAIPSNNEQKTLLKTTAKQEFKVRKTTKLLNYVPPRKREHQRTIDRLQPGKSKGNLINSVSAAKKTTDTDAKPDLIATKVKEIKNSLIVETSEGGPKLSLGTVLDAEGFGLVQQHNFQDDKPKSEETDDKVTDGDDADLSKSDEPLRWGEISKKDESPNKKSSDTDQAEEENDKKKDEPKPNLSAWFKAFGIPKKQPTQPSNLPKDGSCGDSLSQALGVASSLPQPMMRQRKSSTGSTTSELSSVSQDPDSPRITIDESYTGSYKSPIQLPIVTSPKPDEFSPRQQGMSNYEINGPIKVGFYQDTTKCSPDKSPQEMANTTPQYSMAHRTPPNSSLTASLQNNFSYYTKTDTTTRPPSTSTTSLLDQCSNKKADHSSNHDNSDYSGSPNNPNSPYQNQPMSPYLQNPNSPFTSQSHNNMQQQGNASQPFSSQNTQSLLSSSHGSKNHDSEKSSSSSSSDKQMSNNNNEPKRIQPPTYSSTPQYSLANLQKQTTETSKASALTESAIPGSSDINTPHYSSSSASNQVLNIKSSSDQTTWPPQGLYGPNIDKNLFPLSLTNATPATTDLSQSHNTNNNNSSNMNQQQSSSQDLSNNQSSYGQMPPSYTGFDIRQKQKADCMNSDPVSLVAKNQDLLRKQQSLIASDAYDNKTPIDYATPSSERYKSSEYGASAYAKNLIAEMQQQGSKNQNTSSSFDTQNRQQQQQQPKSSMPSSSTNMPKQYSDHLQQQQQQQSMFGNNRNYLSNPDPVDLKSSSSASSSAIPHSNHPKPLDSQGINPYATNNYMAHGQQSQNPATDYTMGAPIQNARYTDLSRQTPAASHQQSQMDAYKSSAYIRNFASMMAEMGLPTSAQNPYSQSMAHQFAKTFHQVTTAALQQFLPGSSMTTTAYSKSSREDDTRSASSKGFPSSSQQTSSSSVISQYLSGNAPNAGTREPPLTSQQQQHMVAYQQKFSEAANMSQTPDLSSQGHPMEMKQTSRKSKSSSKKSKQQQQTTASQNPQEMLMNPGAMSQSGAYPSQPIPPAHNFPSYGSSNIAGKMSDTTPNAASTKVANSSAGVSGSAFNFTPTPSLQLPGPPPGLYGETPNYLDDFRGTTNPYYPIAPPTGHRNPPGDISAAAADKNNAAGSANTSTVSSPYHQFLPHPGARTGYPFMNPASFDPLQQQWNLQREEQLRAQMMLASNPYSQSGYPRHLWG